MYVCLYIVGAFSFCLLHKARIEELVSECKRGRERESKGKSVREVWEHRQSKAQQQQQQSATTTQNNNNRAPQQHSTTTGQYHNTNDGVKEAREVRVQVSLTLIVQTYIIGSFTLLPTRCQVSSCSQIEEQIDTWYRVEPRKGVNSILSIEMRSVEASTRYPVSTLPP